MVVSSLFKVVAAAALVVATPYGPAGAQIDATGTYTVGTIGDFLLPYGTCTAEVVQTGTSIEFSFDCIGGNFLLGTGTIAPGTGEFTITGTCDTQTPPANPPAPLTAYGTAFGSTFVLYGTCQGIESIYVGNKCGNGLLDAGEDCDDGNHEDGDCCSGTCTAETGNICSAASPQCTVATCDSSGTCVPGAANQPAGTQCDTDADLCASEEVCDGNGSCEATGNSLDCGLCASCDAAQGCVAVWPERHHSPEIHPERGYCRKAGSEKARLINRLDGDDRDLLVWNWAKGNGVLRSDFGTLSGPAAFTLCLYGQGNIAERKVIGELAIPGESGWSTAPGGYRYRDELADGTKVEIDLRASAQDGKPRIKVKIKGGGLDYPEGIDDALSPSLRHAAIKLTADNGQCWASSLGVLKNSGIRGDNEKLHLKNCFPNWQQCR